MQRGGAVDVRKNMPGKIRFCLLIVRCLRLLTRSEHLRGNMTLKSAHPSRDFSKWHLSFFLCYRVSSRTYFFTI